ncbi:uncharacterized protein [Amphiura filiformis]|uniref:uncharacterized protein n=1 Tax=Amphiura filiformis TaxID=82378 RepID=UPI003B2183E0
MSDEGNTTSREGFSESVKSRKRARVEFEDLSMSILGNNGEGQPSQQKKVGPLGRRRRNTALEAQLLADARELNHTTNQHATTGMTSFEKFNDGLKQLGMRISIKAKYDEKKLVANFSKSKGKNFKKGSPSRPDLDREINGYTGIHIAAQNNNVNRISDLIRRGADVNVKSSLDGATPLHMSARYNHPDAAMVLLQKGADVADALTNGQTPLHMCCRRGHLQVAVVLIQRGKSDLNSRDVDKSTPLHQATLNGNIELVTYLVERGADIRALDVNNVSPMMQAAHCGFKDCVQYLLAMGLHVGIPFQKYLSDKDNEGNTALHLAVGNRHIDVARALIERGAPVNCKKSTNGFTPLHQAAIIGEEQLAQMLIDKGAETEIHDNEQMTPLHRSAMYNRVDTILLLIRQGLYLDSKDEDNFTPLLCAAWKGQTEAGKALLRYGADIRVLDMEMKSCLHWAVEMQHLEFAKMLFEHGHGGEELLNWKDRGEQTSLHYAAEVGNVEVLNVLLQNGAEVVVKDVEEKTPLHIASEYGHLECVESLYHACPVPLNDDDIDDMTPLLLASQNGHHHVVKFLIRVGADIESRNDDRRSSLALAATNNEINVLNVLLNNNANVNGYDKDQNTALHLCAQGGHEASTILLLNNGADLQLQNVHGMYPLDLAIEHKHEVVAKAMLSSTSWEAAMNNLDYATGHSPMNRLIAVLPEAALLVMDQCVKKSHDDPYHPDLKITYNYRYIDPGPDDISFDKTDQRFFALETMVEFKREKLLAHALSQTSLSSKWKRYARYFNYGDFFIYLIFVVMVSVYLELLIPIRDTPFIIIRESDGCPLVPRFINESEAGPDHGPSSGPPLQDSLGYPTASSDEHPHLGPEDLVRLTISDDSPILLVQIFILCFVSIRAFMEVLHMINARLQYWKRPDNYLHWAMFIVTFTFVFPPYLAPCDVHWVAGTIAVFVTWMNFIFVLNRFDFFGLYVTMFFTTLKSLIKAMSVYGFFIIGFGLAFYICFQNRDFQETNEAFRSEWSSIITTFVMTLGEINKSDLLDTGVSLHPFDEVANFLVLIFLFLMPMVLINLTIGISVGDIEAIMESSYFKRFSLQVDIIHRIEKRLPRRLQRAVWLPTGEFWPNKTRSALVRKIKPWLGGSSTKFLRKSQEEAEKEITVRDVMNEVTKHENSISSLTVLVQQQGKLLSRIAEKHDIKLEIEPSLTLSSSTTHGRYSVVHKK